jgi:hypothetical protein
LNFNHIKWLIDTKKRLKTADGKTIEVWEFIPENNDTILSAWAKHYRNHYCLDADIDELIKGTGYSKREYLLRIKFPDAAGVPGQVFALVTLANSNCRLCRIIFSNTGASYSFL